jgi:hypothetical protein
MLNLWMNILNNKHERTPREIIIAAYTYTWFAAKFILATPSYELARKIPSDIDAFTMYYIVKTSIIDEK